MHKAKRILMGAIIFIAVALILIMAFISPIGKYLLEKYSIPLTGRKIKVGWVYLDPFTGYASLHGLKIYEYKSDSIFLSAKSLSARYSILKTINKTYEISSITLDEPNGVVIQDSNYFNFNDIIKKFTPNHPPDTTKRPTRFNMLNIKIHNGVFRYMDRSAGVNYFIRDVNISSHGLRWNSDTMDAEYSIKNGPGTGAIKGDFNINLKNINYSFSALVKDYDLQILEQYLHGIANYGNFTAKLDADIRGTGNLKDSLGINANGFLDIRDFHFGKTPGNDFVSFHKLAISMKEVNPSHYVYLVDSLMVDHPFFKYEKYDSLDNLQRMFGKSASKYKSVKADKTKFNLIVEIAKYLEELAKNFLQSYYKVGKVAIYNGDIGFKDYSLNEEFSIAADPLFFNADSIDKNNPWLTLSLKSGIRPYGNIAIQSKINPRKYSDFTINYKLEKVPATVFNPYLLTYTSFPLNQGMIEMNGNWYVRDSMIESTNHLLIIDPRQGRKAKKKDTKWIPVPLIMSIVRAPGSAIDYTIPITGNLNHPHYIIRDAIMTVVRNIFVKPPLTPYLLHVKQMENQVEKYETLTWGKGQVKLTAEQQKFVRKIADFVNKTPGAAVSVYPVVYTALEKENAMFFEAKMKYFLRGREQGLSERDSLKVDKMSIKDPAFRAYLDSKIKDTLMYTVQEKCKYFVGETAINKRFNNLLQDREREFLSYFTDSAARNRVRFYKPDSGVPFNGFSYYKLVYNGEIPEDLIKAYDDMRNLNNETPRDKYRNARRKNREMVKNHL